MTNSPTRNYLVWVSLLIIVALGSGLRLYGLDIQSLWNDELESWRQSNFNTLGEVLSKGILPDNHPPGFQWILYLVEKNFGDTETLLRLPSAISGILSIVAIFWMGHKIFSYKEGLIAAFFMAILWCPIFYSQEARNYALVMLFTLLASSFWMDIILKLNRGLKIPWQASVGYVVSSIGALYSHYFGLLLILLQAIGAFILTLREWRDLRYIFAIYALIFLAYLPWIPSMYEQFTHVEGISWIRPPKITAFPAYISFAFNRSKPLALVVLLFYGSLFFQSLSDFRKTSDRKIRSLLVSPDFLLGYWLILPLTLVFIVSITLTPLYTQRNLIISLPAAYILLARAITRLPVNRFLQTMVTLVIGGLALYNLFFVLGYYKYPYKEQFREAVQFVVERNPPNENSLIIGYSHLPDYFNYYFERQGSDLRVELIAGNEEDIGEVESYLSAKKPDHIWFIVGHKKAKPEFIDYLESNHSILDHQSFLGAQVWFFSFRD